MNTTTTPKKDLYAQVTDSIIAMMEAGVTSRITWAQTGHGIPCNHKTGVAVPGRERAAVVGGDHDSRLLDRPLADLQTGHRAGRAGAQGRKERAVCFFQDD